MIFSQISTCQHTSRMEDVMLKHKDHFHGSDLEQIEKIYNIKKNELVETMNPNWEDLSEKWN